jgi:hypothetical protein
MRFVIEGAAADVEAPYVLVDVETTLGEVAASWLDDVTIDGELLVDDAHAADDDERGRAQRLRELEALEAVEGDLYDQDANPRSHEWPGEREEGGPR